MSRKEAVNPVELIESGRSPGERLYLAWDLAMIVLVLLNLCLIAFDMLFSVDFLASAMAAVVPAAHDWYLHSVHQNFFTIDLVFVAIFLFDLALGWVIAIVKKTYLRWYFYPFAHWYDALGCIPVAGFRLLRILRIVSILIRCSDWVLSRFASGASIAPSWSITTFLLRRFPIASC